MKVRFSPLKFLDYFFFLSLVLVFISLPATNKQVAPRVKAAVAPSLTLPQPKADFLPAPASSAQAIYIFDPLTGTTIYEKNSASSTYPASTTKLMTALVALKSYDTDQVLTVKSASGASGQTINLASGDQLTVENLLYGLLVDSGNDAAVTLAENYPGGYTQFIDEMNQEAQKLGLTGTHFANVAGFEIPDHYTTARDLTLIANQAINNATIRKIVSTKSITISDITGQRKFKLESTNKLLGFNGVKGLKTGWTPASGECLVTLVTRDGRSILVTLLNSTDRFGESARLINWVYDSFDWREI